MNLRSRFAPFFPIGDGLVRLEVVEPWGSEPDDPNRASVVVRLIIFEEGPDGPTIRDVKEQQLYVGLPKLYEDGGRVDEMLYAQREVLGEVLQGPVERFESRMPHELFFTNVLSLVRAHTRQDFARALRAKSRLGRYLSA